MMDAVSRLRRVAENLPPGASVTVPREWLLEALESHGNGSADLTVAQLAEQLGRSKSCVRSWLENRLLRGYKLRGREWRIPAAALAEFQERERRGETRCQTSRGGTADLSAWKNARTA